MATGTQRIIKLTEEELDLLQSIMGHIINRLDWQEVGETSLMKAEVLLNKDRFDTSVINKIYNKLF